MSGPISWDVLLLSAARQHYGSRSRVVPSIFTREDKKLFIAHLLNDARSINPREPQEISRNVVDVIEKVYYNCNKEGSEDTTTIKFVDSVESTDGHNYHDIAKKGILWDVNTNVGQQFGLPLVEAGSGAGLRYVFKWQAQKSFEEPKLQSQHEEVVKIPPGKKVVVKMTSYRVRYKLDYTMEYGISKSADIRIRLKPCGIGLCAMHVSVKAAQLLELLPGYREDDRCVYFTQEGELRWIADRMEVKKTIMDA